MKMKATMRQQIAVALALAMVLIFAAFALIMAMLSTFVPFGQAARLNVHIYDIVDSTPVQSTSPTVLYVGEFRTDIALYE